MKKHENRERAKNNFLTLCEAEGYELIGEYVNNKKKIKVVCPKRHHWEVRPNNFVLSNHRCAICSNKSKAREAKKVFLKLCKFEGYEVLSEYVNKNKKVRIRCPLKHEFEASPANFKSAKNKCPVCYNRNAREKWELLMKCSRYEALSQYKNSTEKVLVRCNWCGKEFFARPKRLYSDRGCPRCGGSDRETARESFYRKLFLNDIEAVGDYVNSYTAVEVMHIYCKTIWRVTPKNFVDSDRCRCPICKKNKGGIVLCKELK
ncbi:hypothetical protein [Bacillus cereus]